MATMKRRVLLQSLLAVWPARLMARAQSPGPPAWAAGPAFANLQQALGSRLVRVESPLEACAQSGGAGATALFARLKNPYYLGDEPSLTQTLGWTGAWVSRHSAYAVRPETADDVATAVQFARAARVKLVVKGGGHSYFGNSTAPDSLLLWTRAMDLVDVHDGFVPAGAPAGTRPRHAVSNGAGALWGRVYETVSVRHGRYVQGGGCLTVGVAGLVQGGGFGSLSKAFGTAAASLLEAEIVTADGVTRVASAWREPELFFALRGGGGGTFGVVTRLTLATHPLQHTMGGVFFSVAAANDAAWAALVRRTIAFYADALFNPAWGEQIRFSPGRRLDVSMVFHGLSREEAARVWEPLLAWVRGRSDYAFRGDPQILAVPGRQFWDPAFLRQVPGIVMADDRPGAPASNVFWASNLGETGQVLHAYESVWLPARLIEPSNQGALADALVAGASSWSVTLHVNKGMAGGEPTAIAASAETATNPAMLDAFALLICAADGPPAWPGIPGHEPDVSAAAREAARVAQAVAPVRRLVTRPASYMSETSYFDEQWEAAYWGTHYSRLQAAKRKYDPENVFRGHHTVRGG